MQSLCYSIDKILKLFVDQCLKRDAEVDYMSKVLYASAAGCLMYAIYALDQMWSYLLKVHNSVSFGNVNN